MQSKTIAGKKEDTIYQDPDDSENPLYSRSTDNVLEILLAEFRSKDKVQRA